MARPIWSGTISFGLLNIPVQLMSGERRTDIQFRMLDSRDNSPIRYERVNADTGEEVAWKDVVKAYEYDKGSYVVLEQDDIRSAAPESHDSIDVEAFVDAEAIGPQYFEKPYVLVPAKRAEKGYVLLRDALASTGRIGVARVVIRTREHLCALLPQGDALLLLMMRYPQELVDVEDYNIPEGKPSDYRITPKEKQFSEQLIESMSADWKPDQYKDEFRAKLHQVIKKRMKSKGVVKKEEEEPEVAEHAATNVVDFMSLLQQSIDRNKRTPAKKRAAPAKKAPRKAAKKAAKARKAPARKRKTA
ncbi:Ku protein [Luteimonas gilva]|uniref:Non-homologous end joining protein Ku n=1 Tax=Luteimonas gilva TaxID=2572684 RepID=A0A4U5JUD6_9GAMM|nr:Ku protein [Luteimonas gilva]TKR33462.1 Ku protein [Luteimonas gilva]